MNTMRSRMLWVALAALVVVLVAATAAFAAAQGSSAGTKGPRCAVVRAAP